MIDKKKLIEILWKQHDKIMANPDLYEDAEEVANEICQVVSFIDEQPKTDWIPCEESLPSEIEASIVTIDDGEVCIGVYRTDDKVWYTRRIEGETVYTKEHKVIAWQPLPQSYEKEGEIDD